MIRKKPKSRKPSRLLIALAVIAAIGGALYFALSSADSLGLASYLPFPKKLIALRFQHNGQEVFLLPDSQCTVNPRDSLQLIQIKTDGWLSWGTTVGSSDFDVKAIQKKPAAIKDLFPKESFEAPKSFEVRALLWNRPIGKVSFLVQLDAKDWLQKANSTDNAEKKAQYLEKALRENPTNVPVKTQLAGIYFEKKKYDEALKLYKEIDESGKTKEISERLLAIYQSQNRVDDALTVYLDLFKLADDAALFKEFVQYIQKRKSKEEAGRFLEKHQGEIPKGYQGALLLLMADLNTQSKNWSKAATAYEKAIKSGIKDPDVLYNLAVTYQQSDDPDKAVQALQRYLQKNPGDVKSWLQLGELQEKKGAVAQARSTYESILQKNPQNKEALMRLVGLLEKLNDKSALQGAYERLAQAQPKNKTVQRNLGILYYDGKKYDKAAKAFEAIAAMDPKDVESRKYLLDIYRKQQNEKAAQGMLQALAQLDPKNAAYYDTIFKSFDDKKDYKGMVSFFRTAAGERPDSVAVHNYLLYGLLKQGDTKGAAKELDQLIRLQPKEKKHLRQAARLWENAGDYDQALKKLEVLLKLDPKDKEIKEDYMRVRMLSLNKKKKPSEQ